MGKGRIVSGGTDGSYTVELLHNRDRIDAEIAFLTAKLAELQDELDALETEREGMVAERNAIATDIDTVIANTEEGEIPDVEALLVELAQVSAQIQSQDVRIAMIEGRMLEATKRKEMLDAVPADPQQQAWCADHTEDLTGEVATVEVPAEGVVGQFLTWRRVHIRPGHAGRATYNAARDGQMHHREGQVGYQAYFNAAILPGVQRHKPQYRIGTITAINSADDTCSLTIQGEDSSAQSLIIDPSNLVYTKTGVPIEYMECDSDAFEVGDRVLVEFQGRDWDAPKVIGFEKEPRLCLPPMFIFEIDIYAIQDFSTAQWFEGGTVPSACPDNWTDRWFENLPLRAQVPLSGRRWCKFDPDETDFETECATSGYSMTDTQVAVATGQTNQNTVLHEKLVGSLAVEIEIGGVSVYERLDVEYDSRAWVSLAKPWHDEPTQACLDESARANQQTIPVHIEDMPEIKFPLVPTMYKPIAFIGTTDNEIDRVLRVRVLCEPI